MEKFMVIVRALMSMVSDYNKSVMWDRVGELYDIAYEAGRKSEAEHGSGLLGVDWTDILYFLTQNPPQKIQAIKELRAQTNTGLRESKDLIDGLMPFVNPRAYNEARANREAHQTKRDSTW